LAGEGTLSLFIPFIPRRFRRLDLGAYGASVLDPTNKKFWIRVYVVREEGDPNDFFAGEEGRNLFEVTPLRTFRPRPLITQIKYSNK